MLNPTETINQITGDAEARLASVRAERDRYRELLEALVNSPEGLTPNQLRAIDMVLTPERFIQK